jgi:hypothetical protein
MREAALPGAGETAHSPERLPSGQFAGAVWLAARTGMTRVAQAPEPRLTINIQDATRGLPLPRMVLRSNERRGRRGRAAGIVTRMCRDAAGGSVARGLPRPAR